MRRRVMGVRTVSLLVAILLYSVATAASAANVDKWVAGEAADYVAKQLRSLPRLRDSTVRFVVFEDGRPATRSNRLALRLRDKLRDTVTRTGGVRVAWEPGEANSRLPATGADCEAGREHLLVGIELTDLGGRFLLVTLRALDVVEKQWIAGFAREWRGELSRGQHRALLEASIDRSFLGDRGVPYGDNESDLIARHLAQDLRCQLMRTVGGEYRITAGSPPGAETRLAGILPLVRKQVAGVSSIRVIADEADANARLESQLHAVDRTLHQYWITLTPDDDAIELQPLSASVYISLSGGQRSISGMPSADAAILTPAGGILDALQVIDGMHGDCVDNRPSSLTGSLARRASRCAALRVAADDDAIVFVLNHQLNRGLVRLDPLRCGRSPSPRIVRRNEALTIGLPGTDARAPWTTEDHWSLRPGGDTYYAVATTNSKAARALAAHISRLPVRCSESVRYGLTGDALKTWLGGFAREFDRWSPETDWHAVRLQQVY